MRQKRARWLQLFLMLLFFFCGFIRTPQAVLAADSGQMTGTKGYFTLVINDEVTGKTTTQKVNVTYEIQGHQDPQKVSFSLSGTDNHNVTVAGIKTNGGSTYSETQHGATADLNNAEKVNGKPVEGTNSKGETVYKELAYTVFQVQFTFDRPAYTYLTSSTDSNPDGTRFNSYAYDWQCSNTTNTLNKKIYNAARKESFTLQVNMAQTGVYLPAGSTNLYNATYTINIRRPNLKVTYNANGATSGSTAGTTQYVTYTGQTTGYADPYGGTLGEFKNPYNFSTFGLARTGYVKNTGYEWNTKADDFLSIFRLTF